MDKTEMVGNKKPTWRALLNWDGNWSILKANLRSRAAAEGACEEHVADA